MKFQMRYFDVLRVRRAGNALQIAVTLKKGIGPLICCTDPMQIKAKLKDIARSVVAMAESRKRSIQQTMMCTGFLYGKTKERRSDHHERRSADRVHGILNENDRTNAISTETITSTHVAEQDEFLAQHHCVLQTI